jgi:hypothetical protein
MKSQMFPSLKTDDKVLIILLCLGFAAVIGCLLPAPYDISHAFGGFISVTFGILVWCLFRLIEPRRYSRRWAIAELTVVPIVWMLLMLALAVWFYHLRHELDWFYAPRN